MNRSRRTITNEGNVGTPAALLSINDYREERQPIVSKDDHNDDVNLNLARRLSSEENNLKTRGQLFKIGTWNVRTLNKDGKMENLIQEMNRLNVDIMGVGETRWIGNGKHTSENHVFVYSGGEQHIYGVGIGLLLKRTLLNR